MASHKKGGSGGGGGFGGISVADSMFACLPCDDEAEIKRKNRGKKKENDDSNKQQQQQKKQDAAHNKNKNKNSLQSAAVLSNKSKKKSQTPPAQLAQPPPPQPPPPPQAQPASSHALDPQWEQWQERDAENVDTEYENDLKQALELSRIEAEQIAALRAIADADPSPPTVSSSSGVTKKKKKKNNNSEAKVEKTVHLSTFLSETPDPVLPVPNVGEFLNGDDSAQDAQSGTVEDSLIITPHFATLVPRPKTYEVDSHLTPLGGGGGEGGGDSSGFRVADRTKEGSKEKETSKREAEERAFLSQVQRDVGKIIRKEECTEFMKQNEQLISEIPRCAQYQDEIDQKNSQISELETEIENMKVEFAKVKKRNKQLAFIISQGEMQEKADLLTEIDELKEVKDELTSQTAQLQQELEQERTKNHKMAKELQSFKGHKGGKHSSPSASEP